MKVLRAAKNLTAGALSPFVRALTASRGRILMFHRFAGGPISRRLPSAVFEEQIRYLADHFRPRALRDVVRRFKDGETLEPGTVVVTVDDGYRDFFEFAYPVLLKYEIPCTVYLVSDFVSQKVWLWFDALHWLVHSTRRSHVQAQVDSHTFESRIVSDEDRHKLWLQLTACCTTLAPSKQSMAIADLQTQLEIALPAKPTQDYAAMSWDEVRKLDGALIEVGAHTKSHPILATCTGEQQRIEIAECKRAIEAELGARVNAFCYPNGQPDDFTDETVRIVREVGFSSAVMACGGMLDPGPADLLRLRRVAAPDDVPMFRNCLNGLWELRNAIRPHGTHHA